MLPRIPNQFGKRLVVDRRGLKPEDMLYVEICIAAGCRYRGIQRAVPECGLEARILFDDAYGSSLALTPSQFNLENVRIHLAESNARWAAAEARRAEEEKNGLQAEVPGNAGFDPHQVTQI
jgi:hypothetical protein